MPLKWDQMCEKDPPPYSPNEFLELLHRCRRGSQSLLGHVCEIILGRIWRIAESGTDPAQGRAEEVRFPFEMVAQELIRMQGFNAVEIQCLAWKIPLVLRHDDITPTDDGCS